MVDAAIAVLLEEVRADRAAVEQHARTLRAQLASAPWAEGAATLAVVAIAAHHFYGAAESIFERIARAFEGVPERSDRWHQDLLSRMTLAIDGVRPALLRPETARALAPLLGFRHFFRHAYAVPLDPRRLQLTAEDALRATELLLADLEELERVLLAAKST